MEDHLKKQSIPRLELLGTMILARPAKTLQNTQPQRLKSVFWVDSMIVLCWIKNLKLWKQYISRTHISGVVESLFRQPETSREEMVERPWISAQTWEGMAERESRSLEWRKCLSRNCAESNDYHTCFDDEFTSAAHRRSRGHATCYSSWNKLLHVTTYVVQFFRRTGFERSLNVDNEELRHTEEFWIKSKEYQSFQDEMCHMMWTEKTPVPLLIRQFNLYVDVRGSYKM